MRVEDVRPLGGHFPSLQETCVSWRAARTRTRCSAESRTSGRHVAKSARDPPVLPAGRLPAAVNHLSSVIERPTDRLSRAAAAAPLA